MTAVNRKTKPGKLSFIYSADIRRLLKVIVAFALGAGGALAKPADIPLCAAGLAAVVIHREFGEKISCFAGYLCAVLWLFFTYGGYVEYFVAAVIYISCFITLKNEKISLFACSVALGGTAFFLSFTALSSSYRMMGAVQGVVFYFFCLVACDGQKTAAKNTAFEDLPSLTGFICFLEVYIFCAGGFDTGRFYPGAAVGLALCWEYIRRGAVSHSAVSMVCTALSVFDKKALAVLIVLLVGLWFVGGCFAEKISLGIYPAVLFTALCVNLAFMGSFEGFAPVGTSILALMIYTVLPLIKGRKTRQNMSLSRHKDYIQLMSAVERLEGSLAFLGRCMVDISRLNRQKEPKTALEDMVADQICRKCQNSSLCWGQSYSDTYRIFAKYAKEINRRKTGDFPPYFYSVCPKTRRLKSAFEENSRLIFSRRYIAHSQKNSRKMLQSAFLTIASAVGDTARNSCVAGAVNSAASMGLDSYLNGLGLKVCRCICRTDPDTVTFALRRRLTDRQAEKIRRKIHSIYNRSFRPFEVKEEKGEFIYTARVCPSLEYRRHISQSRHRRINGDSTCVFTLGESLFVILCDGIGTGYRARAQSRTAAAMAKSLIEAGVRVDNAVELLNIALNLKGGEGGSAVDIMQLNLFSGKGLITKAGGAASALLSKGDSKIISGASLPLGVVKDIKTTSQEIEIKAGDRLIIASDGVSLRADILEAAENMSAKEYANFLLAHSRRQDDKTVVCLEFSSREETAEENIFTQRLS